MCISEEYAQLQNEWHCQLQSRAAVSSDELERERVRVRAEREAAESRARGGWMSRSKQKRAAPPAPAEPSRGTLGLQGRLNLSPTLVHSSLRSVFVHSLHAYEYILLTLPNFFSRLFFQLVQI